MKKFFFSACLAICFVLLMITLYAQDVAVRVPTDMRISGITTNYTVAVGSVLYITNGLIIRIQ